MKTKIVNGLVILMIIASVLMTVGGYGYYYYFLNGTAKSGLPGIGGAVRVESMFPDNTFVGVHAGKRRFYKNADAGLELRPGAMYEVIKTEDRGILGPTKKTMKLLR